jgi:uncharacterized delta-60 repeat protein
MHSEKMAPRKPAPVFTTISLITTFAVSIAVFVSMSQGDWGGGFLLMASVAAGVVINVITGICAAIRREPTWGLIAMLGIILWPLEIELRSNYYDYRRNHVEHGTWGNGAISDFIVQPDGKIVLWGHGLARLLPDGSPAPSFHGGSTVSLLGTRQLPGATTLMQTNGDMIVSSGGRITYLRSDGSKEPQRFAGLEPSMNCWGLAVEPDGNLLAACNPGSNGNGLVRVFPGGGIDPVFHSFVLPPSPDPTIIDAGIAKDGKILLAGWVQPSSQIVLSNLSQPSTRTDCFSTLTRLNSDGSLDTGFRSGQQCRSKEEVLEGVERRGAFAFMRDGSILAVVAVRRDGKDWRVVEHLDPNGREIPRSHVRNALEQLRLVTAILPLDDGRILVGGADVRRFMSDGTQDPTFQVAGKVRRVKKFLLQGEQILMLDEDGHLSRLNNNGAIDPAFRIPVLKT